jgi:hypothetical protein
MNNHQSGHDRHRPVNKANMDQPQEEFIADEAIPSHSDPVFDRDHGAEVDWEPARQPVGQR